MSQDKAITTPDDDTSLLEAVGGGGGPERPPSLPRRRRQAPSAPTGPSPIGGEGEIKPGAPKARKKAGQKVPPKLKPKAPLRVRPISANLRIDSQDRELFPGEPDMPEVVRKSKGAREEWDRIVPLLSDAGTLKPTDVAILSSYCIQYARWQEAERKLRENGVVVMGQRANKKPNIYLKIADEAAKLCRAFAAELGITPAARGKILGKGADSGSDDEDSAWTTPE